MTDRATVHDRDCDATDPTPHESAASQSVSGEPVSDPVSALSRSIQLRQQAEVELGAASRSRQAALTQADSLLAETREVVEALKATASIEAGETVQEARERAAGIVVGARSEAAQITDAARAEAAEILGRARDEGERILADAESEAAATLADAGAGVEQMLEEGRAALALERQASVDQTAAELALVRREAAETVSADLAEIRTAFAALGAQVARVEERLGGPEETSSEDGVRRDPLEVDDPAPDGTPTGEVLPPGPAGSGMSLMEELAARQAAAMATPSETAGAEPVDPQEEVVEESSRAEDVGTAASPNEDDVTAHTAAVPATGSDSARPLGWLFRSPS